MSFRVQCPCGASLRVASRMEGTQGTCPTCERQLRLVRDAENGASTVMVDKPLTYVRPCSSCGEDFRTLIDSPQARCKACDGKPHASTPPTKKATTAKLVPLQTLPEGLIEVRVIAMCLILLTSLSLWFVLRSTLG